MIWKTKTVQLPGSIKREFSIISRAMNWKSTVCCLTCSEYHLLQSKVHQSGHSLNPCLVFTQNACLNCSGLCSQMKVPGNSESSSHFQLLTAFWDKKALPKQYSEDIFIFLTKMPFRVASSLCLGSKNKSEGREGGVARRRFSDACPQVCGWLPSITVHHPQPGKGTHRSSLALKDKPEVTILRSPVSTEPPSISKSSSGALHRSGWIPALKEISTWLWLLNVHKSLKWL